MPFLKTLPDDAGPRTIFTKYPDIYRSWSELSEALMNGPSPLTKGERELILSYAAGVAGCDFVCGAHAEVAYALGIERGLLEQLLTDDGTAPVSDKLKPLLAFVRKLMLTPNDVTQSDADQVLEAGWDEKAYHDAIAITARAAFMQRLVGGFGFTPLSKDEAGRRAQGRAEQGYVNIFPEFRK